MNSRRILLLPGIGDVHWAALKLQAFKERNGIERLDAWIWQIDSRRRTLEYLQRLPFLNAMGYWVAPIDSVRRSAFDEVYMHGTRDIIAPFDEFDYLFAVNGSLRQGRDIISQILPDYPVDWNYPVAISDEDMARGLEQRERGPYVLLYFAEGGMFRRWLHHWPIEAIRVFIHEVGRALPGYTLILTGSSWDEPLAQNVIAKLDRSNLRDYTGKTSLGDLLGLIKFADGFAGWCGGNTIVATHLGTPTYMLWSDYFCREMQTNWADPDKVGSIYQYADVSIVSPEAAARLFVAQVEAKAFTEAVAECL